MRRLTVSVHATNVCVTHTEGDVINNLPHPQMMMNLIFLRKKWSGQNRTGRTGSAATAHTHTHTHTHTQRHTSDLMQYLSDEQQSQSSSVIHDIYVMLLMYDVVVTCCVCNVLS